VSACARPASTRAARMAAANANSCGSATDRTARPGEGRYRDHEEAIGPL
jgi:hypothetical protein